MESPSFVVSLNSLVNSFFTFPIKLPPEMKSDRDFRQRSAASNNSVGSVNLNLRWLRLSVFCRLSIKQRIGDFGEIALQRSPLGNGLEFDVAIAGIRLQALLHERGDVVRNAG